MREMAISKFKAQCLAVVAEVQRTGSPVRITRYGKPIAELSAPKSVNRKSWFGSMRGTAEICGDIVGPIGAFDEWNVYKK